MAAMTSAGLVTPSASDAFAESRPATGLVMDMETMACRLEHELRDGPTLDAYLLAAGVAQIVDDHLHQPAYPFGRAARYLEGHGAPAARLAGAGAAAIDGAIRAARRRTETTRTVIAWRAELEALVDALADAEVAALIAGPEGGFATAWMPELERLPISVRETVVRVPTCFAHFDQRPADVVSLARRFAERRPDRDRPLLVAGVRTSGSYLAPLCAASLRALGYRSVSTITVRPGHGLLAREQALIRDVAAADGLALVLDDPAVTGGSVRDAAETIAQAGIAAGSIVLLLATFGAAESPPALGDYEAVLLGGADWAVEADLLPAAVQRTLQSLPGDGSRVLAVEPVQSPYRQPPRGHRRELFRVRTRSDAGEESARLVLVEGVGLGYLGAHRVDNAALLPRFSAPIFGLRDGLLYREWLPDERRVGTPGPAEEAALADALASYAVARRGALPCRCDLSVRMGDEQPAWLVASNILSAVFGRAWPVARVIATDRVMRQLLTVTTPSVVDGNTDLAHWFRREDSPTQLIKPDIGEDGFSNLTAQCFDAVFDLAGATARVDSTTLPGRLRSAFSALSGEPVSAERWLVYELVHLWGRERTQRAQKHALRRASARALQRYFAAVYLADVASSPDGPLCALDIDGVLESQPLGFSGATPRAALGLRALLAHGYRPVLVTGRSLDEVAERCRAYGLPGAVAEYGSVIFRAADGRVQSLLDESESRALHRLRSVLAEMDGIEVDPDYRSAVRAFTRRDGQRVALSADQIARALAAADDDVGIQAIAGEGQTDFVGGSIDKGRGLRALAEDLGCRQTPPYALAIGDTRADLPFAGVARLACAPRHADAELGQAGFEVMTSPYQAGTAQAVGRLLGHAPGGCPLCQMPAPSPEQAQMRRLLGAAEHGPVGSIASALELWWHSRSRRSRRGTLRGAHS
jgi:hydroxymethylpyrimidine pyrophosphatase-like HAD family hydrolase